MVPLTSTAAYRALRETGFLTLPSSRTLRDYTHLFEARIGIQAEVNNELAEEAKLDTLEEYQKFTCVAFDEVKVKEGLVFNKHSGQIIGFVDIGDVNDKTEQLEKSIDKPPALAKSMLVFMVRGLFTGLCYPYAQFSCAGLDARKLYPIVWDVIRNLEMIGFKVVAATADGASANRAFLKMHHSPNSKEAS